MSGTNKLVESMVAEGSESTLTKSLENANEVAKKKDNKKKK
jgi:hypothetical protein